MPAGGLELECPAHSGLGGLLAPLVGTDGIRATWPSSTHLDLRRHLVGDEPSHRRFAGAARAGQKQEHVTWSVITG